MGQCTVQLTQYFKALFANCLSHSGVTILTICHWWKFTISFDSNLSWQLLFQLLSNFKKSTHLSNSTINNPIILYIMYSTVWLAVTTLGPLLHILYGCSNKEVGLQCVGWRPQYSPSEKQSPASQGSKVYSLFVVLKTNHSHSFGFKTGPPIFECTVEAI